MEGAPMVVRTRQHVQREGRQSFYLERTQENGMRCLSPLHSCPSSPEVDTLCVADAFVSRELWERRHTCSWHLSVALWHRKGRVDYWQQRLHSPQSSKYWQPGPLQEELDNQPPGRLLVSVITLLFPNSGPSQIRCLGGQRFPDRFNGCPLPALLSSA